MPNPWFIMGGAPQDLSGGGFDTPLPQGQKANRSVQDWLAETIVDPMAQAGWPNAGAAMATPFGVAADVLIPESYGDLMGMAPPIKGGGKVASLFEKRAEKLGNPWTGENPWNKMGGLTHDEMDEKASKEVAESMKSMFADIQAKSNDYWAKHQDEMAAMDRASVDEAKAQKALWDREDRKNAYIAKFREELMSQGMPKDEDFNALRKLYEAETGPWDDAPVFKFPGKK